MTTNTLEQNEAIIAAATEAMEKAQYGPLVALNEALAKPGAKALIDALNTAQPLLRGQRQSQVANAVSGLNYLAQFLPEEIARMDATAEAIAMAKAAAPQT